MKSIIKTIVLCAGISSLALQSCTNKAIEDKNTKYVMVIHGGAGTIEKQHMTEEKEKAYIAALT